MKNGKSGELRKGVYFVYARGDFDARRNKGNENYLSVHLEFLNNHCVSKNFATGIWSIAHRIKEVELIEYDSDPLYE